MNLRAVRAIVIKDLIVLRHAKAVLIPLIVVPLVLLLVLPAVAAFAPAFVDLPGAGDLAALLESMPEAMQARLAGYGDDERIVVLLLSYLFAPLYLILPLMVASVIAADTFAGERERRTLEALIYTPTSDAELLLGKLLAGFLPALAVAWGGFAVYSVVANLAAWPTLGRVFFPTGMWFVLALWVAPAVAAVGLGATVLVSSRVSTFQEAYQIGGAVVLPIVLLVVGQAAGVVVLSTAFVAALGAVFWAAAAVLLWYGARTFRRGELMARA
jgi:ABC-2 type transport system permease protein